MSTRRALSMAVLIAGLALCLPPGQVFAQSCVLPPAGLVAWWPGDGHANDIHGSNHGTIQGGATFAPGMVGQAFSFDGSNGVVVVPDVPVLDLVGDFTVTAWIHPGFRRGCTLRVSRGERQPREGSARGPRESR